VLLPGDLDGVAGPGDGAGRGAVTPRRWELRCRQSLANMVFSLRITS
jgi:hypothetical protein